jgi:hypothetical protein
MNQYAVRNQLLDLDVQTERTRTRLQLSYRVSASRPVFILDALQRAVRGGEEKYDRTLAYISFVPPSTISICKIYPPLPKLKNVLYGKAPWAHRGDVQNEVLGVAATAIPVAECSPYYPSSESSVYREGSANLLRFALHYLPDSADVNATPVPDVPHVFDLRSANGRPFDLRTIQLEIALNTPLPVRIRSDRFERVMG